jgi:hypothetical protein
MQACRSKDGGPQADPKKVDSSAEAKKKRKNKPSGQSSTNELIFLLFSDVET